MVHALIGKREKEGDPGHDDVSVGPSTTYLQLFPMERPQNRLQEVAAENTEVFCHMRWSPCVHAFKYFKFLAKAFTELVSPPILLHYMLELNVLRTYLKHYLKIRPIFLLFGSPYSCGFNATIVKKKLHPNPAHTQIYR